MTETPNTYDKLDRVKREAVVIAGPIKMAAYRVRDPETQEWSPLQFHLTYDNTIMAMLGENSGRMLAKFITDTLDGRTP